MAEEPEKTGEVKNTAGKKPAAKPAAKKPRAAAAKKSAATTRKTTTKKAPVKKTASGAKKPAAAKSTSAASKKTSSTSQSSASTPSTKASETQPNSADEKNRTFDTGTTGGTGSTGGSENAEASFDGTKVIEDLKGRDWGQIVTRALLMFFFGVLGTFALYLAFFLAVTQVVFSIFTGEPNSKLTQIMQQLSSYVKDVIEYLSFASDELPFPFGKDVPSGGE